MKELFEKYREPIVYVFFRGLTTLVSIASFAFFTKVMGMSATAGNVPATIVAVLFAFVTNKLFVFESKSTEKGTVLKEFLSFCAGRVVTFLLEELVLYVGADLMKIDAMFVKIAAQVIQIAGNYLISKFFVFKKN